MEAELEEISREQGELTISKAETPSWPGGAMPLSSSDSSSSLSEQGDVLFTIQQVQIFKISANVS